MLDRLPGLLVAGTMLFFFSGVGCCLGSAENPLTDPTRPPMVTPGKVVQKGKRSSKWRLTSTLIGPQRRVAVINNHAVQVGQKIDGAVLVEVEPGSAWLVQGGRRIHLKMNLTTVKQSPGTAP